MAGWQSMNRSTFVLLLLLTFAWPRVSHAVPQQNHVKAEPAQSKLISLAPSNTELIYSLHSGSKLVAVSDSCDYPPEVKSKVKVGNFSSIKMERIARLQPDMVLLVSGQESLAENLKKHKFRTITVDNSSAANIGKNLIELGQFCNQQKEAKRLADAFDKSIEDLKAITSRDKNKPHVFLCVWPQPVMSAGKSSFMNEGITIAGGINCTGDLPQPYPRINQEKLLLMQPEIIFIPHELGAEKFWTKAPWTSLKAVKEKQLFILPQHETDCLSRPTLRFVDALRWLAIKLHPEMQSEIDKWHKRAKTSLS